MSIDEADALMNEFEKWDAKKAKQVFISRMEHKLYRKRNKDR
jgi:hypothetical protein